MFHFFAYMARMKNILRWGLMRNTHPENNAEHTAQVAMIAHALATLHNTRFGGEVDAGRVAVLALYHDAGEVITGDLATPIKYFNPGIQAAYKEIEQVAGEKLLRMLPEDLQGAYAPLLTHVQKDRAWQFVKAADSIAAYLKCVEELKAGNEEFSRAAQSILKKIEAIDLPEVRAFMEDFVGSFSLTLDELN